MFFIAAAFADWLLTTPRHADNNSSLRISVGADPRLSSPMLITAFTAGLASRDVDVTQFGLCTTPAMFMSCILPEYTYDGAVMITASHLPVNRNGAKFFTPDGGLGKPDIAWILQRAAHIAHEAGWSISPGIDQPYKDVAFVMEQALFANPGLVSNTSFIDRYAAHLRDIVIAGVDHPAHRETPLQGFKIVVNAGNGSGGFFAKKVLEPLGADISGSINLDPDGSFPAHPPNPEDKAAVTATQAAVLSSNADFGVMLDTDVDRSGIVDASGNVINRNRYIALMAAIALRENPGETIVTDSCTSNGLASFIASLGGRHLRYKKGYKNIIDKGVELNKNGVACPLMMETSGHGAMRENYFLDDGAYSALKIVVEAVRRRGEGNGDISSLLESLQEPVEAMEIRVKIKAEDIAAEGKKVTAGFHQWMTNGGAGGASHWKLEDENYEGWRVRVDEGDGKEGWVLVRPSLHDPDIVLNVESERAHGMRKILQHLLQFFKAHPEYDVCTGLVEDYAYNPHVEKQG